MHFSVASGAADQGSEHTADLLVALGFVQNGHMTDMAAASRASSLCFGVYPGILLETAPCNDAWQAHKRFAAHGPGRMHTCFS